MGKINVSFWLEDENFDKEIEEARVNSIIDRKVVMIPFYNEEMKFKPYRIIGTSDVIDVRDDLNIYLEEIKENVEFYRTREYR